MLPQTIVVPLDGSELAERAVRVAAPLAQRFDASVVLVTTPWDREGNRAGSYLDQVIPTLGDIDCEGVVVDDPSPATAISKVAHNYPESVVCMTTHGRGRLRWAVAGSVAEEVVRESTDPLLLVGPRGEAHWSPPARRAVVCVDGSAASKVAVLHACQWARALDLEISLAFVSHPLDVEDAVRPEGIFGPLEDLVRAARLEVRAELIRSSLVAGSLADLSDEPATAMLVMAAHHHSGLGRVALGSVTMGVLNLAGCPVLVIPPERSH